MNEQLARLKAKLRARQGKHEYRDSIPVIEAEIRAIEAKIREGNKE